MKKFAAIVIAVLLFTGLAAFAACEPEAVAATSLTISGEEYVTAEINSVTLFDVKILPENASVKTYKWEVESTNLHEADYEFQNNQLTLKNGAAGYIALKAISDADKNISDRKVVTVNPSFPADKIYHTVTFFDENGKIIDVKTVLDGGSVTCPNYVKDGYDVGWDGSLTDIKTDAEIHAVIEKILYEVSYWYYSDGELVRIGEIQYLEKGEIAVPETAPMLGGYVFLNWSYETDGRVIKCIAVYEAE